MLRAWIDAALVERLGELPPSELWSVWMEVARARAKKRTLGEILAQYERQGFVAPGAVDQRTSMAVERELLAAADAFDAIELAPVAPLGTCSAMALTDQHRVLSALRGTEVVSDPTNVLALESAVRLAKAPRETLRFATCQRVLRAQALPNVPGFSSHFRIFVLATAGHEVAEHAFVVGAIVEHVRVLLRGLTRLETLGYAFGRPKITLLTTAAQNAVGDRIASQLADVELSRKPLDHGYYSGGVRYMLWVTDPDGNDVPLADGGAFDWLGRLTNNRKHVFVASGLGSQLVPIRFRAQ